MKYIVAVAAVLYGMAIAPVALVLAVCETVVESNRKVNA